MATDKELIQKLHELTPAQQETLAKLVTRRALVRWEVELARVLGPKGSIPWKLTDVVDTGVLGNSTCYRGHPIRYEYHLTYTGEEPFTNLDGVRIEPQQSIILGSTCIQLATGIDEKIARAVQNKMYEIKAERDEVLKILIYQGFQNWLQSRSQTVERFYKLTAASHPIQEGELIEELLGNELPLPYRFEINIRQGWLEYEASKRQDPHYMEREREFLIAALRIDPNNVWAQKMLYFIERGEEIFGRWADELEKWVSAGVDGWREKVERGRDEAERLKSLIAHGRMTLREIEEAQKLLDGIEKFTSLADWGVRSLERMEKKYAQNLSEPLYDFVNRTLEHRIHQILSYNDMDYVRIWWEEMGREDILFEIERGDFHPRFKQELLNNVEGVLDKAIEAVCTRLEAEYTSDSEPSISSSPSESITSPPAEPAKSLEIARKTVEKYQAPADSMVEW